MGVDGVGAHRVDLHVMGIHVMGLYVMGISVKFQVAVYMPYMYSLYTVDLGKRLTGCWKW